MFDIRGIVGIENTGSQHKWYFTLKSDRYCSIGWYSLHSLTGYTHTMVSPRNDIYDLCSYFTDIYGNLYEYIGGFSFGVLFREMLNKDYVYYRDERLSRYDTKVFNAIYNNEFKVVSDFTNNHPIIDLHNKFIEINGFYLIFDFDNTEYISNVKYKDKEFDKSENKYVEFANMYLRVNKWFATNTENAGLLEKLLEKVCGNDFNKQLELLEFLDKDKRSILTSLPKKLSDVKNLLDESKGFYVITYPHDHRPSDKVNFIKPNTDLFKFVYGK